MRGWKKRAELMSQVNQGGNFNLLRKKDTEKKEIDREEDEKGTCLCDTMKQFLEQYIQIQRFSS